MFLKIITKKGVPRLYFYEFYYKNGIPLAFDLFPRNASKKVHVCPKTIQVNVTVPSWKKRRKNPFPSTKKK